MNVRTFVPKGMNLKTENQFSGLDKLDDKVTKKQSKKNKKG